MHWLQGMNVLGTPGTPKLGSGQSTPKSSKKVFGSFERGLDKMKNMLTPRKRLNSSDGPVMSSELCGLQH